MKCCLTNKKPRPQIVPHLLWLLRDLQILNSPKAKDLCIHHQGMHLEAMTKGQAMDFLHPNHIITNTAEDLSCIINTIRAFSSPSSSTIKALLS
jgi:hypothetical protein